MRPMCFPGFGVTKLTILEQASIGRGGFAAVRARRASNPLPEANERGGRSETVGVDDILNSRVLFETFFAQFRALDDACEFK